MVEALEEVVTEHDLARGQKILGRRAERDTARGIARQPLRLAAMATLESSVRLQRLQRRLPARYCASPEPAPQSKKKAKDGGDNPCEFVWLLDNKDLAMFVSRKPLQINE